MPQDAPVEPRSRPLREPGQRPLLVVEQHDLAELGAEVVGHVFELLDELGPANVLRNDDVVARARVGRPQPDRGLTIKLGVYIRRSVWRVRRLDVWETDRGELGLQVQVAPSPQSVSSRMCRLQEDRRDDQAIVGHGEIEPPDRRLCYRCDEPTRNGTHVCDDCPEPRCHSGRCPHCEIRWDKQPSLPNGVRAIVVDESSMVNEDLYRDLMRHGRPVIFLGDHGQLPPVRSSFDLMAEHLLTARLETVHRTLADSPILRLAMTVRNTGVLPRHSPGPGVTILDDASALPPMTIGPDLLMLCGKNDTRRALNAFVREQAFAQGTLRGQSDRPAGGDRVICLRNNHKVGIANGALGTVREVHGQGYERDVPCHDATVDLDDDDAPYRGLVAAEQFSSTDTLSETPRSIDLFAYGYALTVHKAQGSEADRVVLLAEGVYRVDYRRWLYTGVTRARRTLHVVRP